MRKPLRPHEKFFIKHAALLENAPGAEIARQIHKSPPPVYRFIKQENLRSPGQVRKIWIDSLKSRHYPAHEKDAEIIRLLNKAKKSKKTSLNSIANKTGVSLPYVSEVNAREKILSEAELSEIRARVRTAANKKRFRERHGVSSYKVRARARKMLANTKKSVTRIAKDLGVSRAFVEHANWKGGKQIRSREENLRIAWNLRPINHFSYQEKVALVEKTREQVTRRLWRKKIPQKFHEEIVDRVKNSLLKKLDYFDPKRQVPLEGFIGYYSNVYTSNAVKSVMKKATAQIPSDKRGQPTVAAKQKTPPEEFSLKQLIGVAGTFVAQLPERERKILALRAEGKNLRQIASAVGLSREGVRKIYHKALKKVRRQLEKQAGQ